MRLADMPGFDDDDLENVSLTEETTAEEVGVDETEERQEKTKALLKEILFNSLYLLAVLILTLFIVKYVGQRTVVYGSSMAPTLMDENNLIVDKVTYRFSEPERFDIIVFPFAYEEDTYYIKRIIGMPGETVRIDEDGVIYITDESGEERILEENYGAEVIEDPGMAAYGITLAADEYFVLGDNRNHSSDSRNPAVGVIHREQIIGKAWLRIYPFADFGIVEHQ